jgi:multidrug resistance efflux pump
MSDQNKTAETPAPTTAIPDQSDVLAQNENLTKQVADLTAKLNASTEQLNASNANVAAATAKLVTVEASLASANAEVARLAPLAESATRQAAAQVSKAGIVSNLKPSVVTTSDAPKMTITEKAILARQAAGLPV